MLLLLSVLANILTTNAQEVTRKWVGYEIIGNTHVSRAEVIQSFPITIGEKFEVNREQWLKQCNSLQEKFKFTATFCGPVMYLNGDVYVVIDIVEKGQEYRNQSRKIPEESIELATSEIKFFYDKLYQRMRKLFDSGVAVTETSCQGYLDYADSEMHEFVLKLAMSVPPLKKNILNVLKNDRDPEKRADAANLLNWTVLDMEETIREANLLLDDPSELVRNNISRFMVHFIASVKSEKIRKDDRSIDLSTRSPVSWR